MQLEVPIALLIQEPGALRRLVRVPFSPCRVGTRDDCHVRLAVAKPVLLVFEARAAGIVVVKHHGGDPTRPAPALALRHGARMKVADVRMRFLARMPDDVTIDPSRCRLEDLSPPILRPRIPASRHRLPRRPSRAAAPVYIPRALEAPPLARRAAPPSPEPRVDAGAHLRRLEDIAARLREPPRFLDEALATPRDTR